MDDVVIEKFSKRTGLKLRPGETEEDAPKERAPRNTAAQDPLFLLMSLMGGASEGIERQEAQGQRELNATSTIPVRYNGLNSAEGNALLCRAGFEIGKEVDGDELFRYCRLPEGWKKVPTEHHLWTSIVDEKGRERGSIFYKAAFYDRDAFAIEALAVETEKGEGHE